MTWLERTLHPFQSGEQVEAQLDAELRFDYEQRVEEKIRLGMSMAGARRATRLEFGGIEQVKEECRDARGLRFFYSVLQDVRHALRGMRRSPGFTIVAVMTLALSLGMNTAVFTLTNTILFKGFPLVERNDRVLYISGPGGVSWPDFQDWRAQARSFEGMAVVADLPVSLSDKTGLPESYAGTRVSANAFQLIGQRPLLGRDFARADETPGAAPVVMLSYGLWDRRYGQDPAIIGQTVRMNGVSTTVIGVMARGFTFPQRQDLWAPLVPTRELQKRENRGLWFVFGRMAEGVTKQSARAEMETIGKRLAYDWPLTNNSYRPGVLTFSEHFIGRNATLIYESLWGAVGFVLLIACANLANLMLVRAVGRSREIAVRMALGAGRWRIIRQILIESVLLSAMGGVAGWWLAKLGVRTYALVSRPPDWFDHVLDYAMDYRVFAYLTAISLATGLLFGLAPVSRLSKLDVNETLKDGGRASTEGGRGKQLSTFLVIGEMALAVVLLAGAGLMIRSFLKMYTEDLGINTRNVVTMQLALPGVRYSRPEAQISFLDRLQTRVAAIPGVESVAIVSSLPAYGSARLPYQLAGAPSAGYEQDERQRPKLSALIISPYYFRTLGAVLLSGRAFNDADGVSGVPVVIVNRLFASQHWPGENPLGKRLRLFQGKAPEAWLTVVGVASDIVQYRRDGPEFNALIYLPYRQKPSAFMSAMVRTRVPPGVLGTTIRREVQAMDSDLPVSWFLTLADRLSWAYEFNGSIAFLFLAFAAIALLLASIGLYAVIAHTVSQRTPEIGIRMAMGATARDILTLVFKQGLLQIGIGLALGLAVSFAVNRLLKAELVQVSSSDPITMAVASAALILAATLGCWIPARRAMRVDPVIALRHE